MKINEKSLSDFACFSDGVNKEGFLEKKGELNSSYKKRWFSLKGNLLFYFEKPGDKQPIGVIIVENCSVEICDSERCAFCLRFPDVDSTESSSSKRTYYLCAENEVEMEKWMKAISSSSYAYIEMVVKEFEETLQRLKSETEPEPEPACARMMSIRNNKLSSSMKVKNSRTNKAKEEESHFLLPAEVDVPKRSKSSENLSKITHYARSPQFLRKKRDAMKEPAKDALPSDAERDESGLSTFEHLHNDFGAAIWTKILT